SPSAESISFDDTSMEESMEVDEERTPVSSPSTRKSVANGYTPLIRRPGANVGRNVARRSSGVGSKLMAASVITKVSTTVQYDGKQQLKTTLSVKRNSCTPRAVKNWTGRHSINTRPHKFVEYTGMTKKCVICSSFLFGKQP
ncbi:hypothetical protein PENTCL1PPCAC_19273, partial [Pristionchus entomophagus]